MAIDSTIEEPTTNTSGASGGEQKSPMRDESSAQKKEEEAPPVAMKTTTATTTPSKQAGEEPPHSAVQTTEAAEASEEADVVQSADVVDPTMLLNDGKRNLACDEIPQAVEALAEACQLLAEKYGECGDELGDAYFYYGKALLELARMENGVLGNALEGVTPENENEADLSESEQFEKAGQTKEEERDEVKGQVYEAMSEQETKSDENTLDAAKDESAEKKPEQAPAEEGKVMDKNKDEPMESTTSENAAEKPTIEEKQTSEAEKSDDPTKDGEEKMDEVGAGDEAESAADTGDEGTSQDEEEGYTDDAPNLQVAWEVLELAKRIYEKTDDKPSKLKVAEIYLTLGDVEVESEQYDGAINDYSSCLKIQAELLDADDRLLAVTHYQLGLAHLLNKAYTEAVEEIKQAKSVIDTRINNIGEQLKPESVDNRTKLEKELEDLKLLLPEIEAKIEDAEDEARNAEKTAKKMKEAILTQGQTQIGFGDGNSTATAEATPISVITTKKANDITNLVRKRKPEEEAAEEAKKPKPDPVVENESGDKENGLEVPITYGQAPAVNGE